MPKLPKSDKPTMADLRRDPERYAEEREQLDAIAREFVENMRRAGEQALEALMREEGDGVRRGD